MTTYQNTYLCLMCLFIVILLVGVLIILITHFKEHKRFQSGVNDAIDDIKYSVRYTYNNSNNIGSMISKTQDDVNAMLTYIATESAKPVDPVDIPIWVAEPCPVCGHKPVILSGADDRDATIYCTHCTNFGYTAGGETVRGAVYMWNKTAAEYLTKVNAQEEKVKEEENGGNNE